MPRMALPLDVCIRGAGIVGRALALLLARERLRVGLVESAEPPPSDVRAFALNAASRDLLQALRAWPDEVQATPVLRMDIQGDEQGAVHFDAREQGVPALAWIADAQALQQRLAEAVRYQPLIEPLAAPQEAALTVVCEGRASASRAGFGVHFDVTHYPQQAIAARLACEQAHGGVARQWFSDGNILAFLPTGGPAGNSVALVWSVRQEHAPGLLSLAPGEFAARIEAASHGALGKVTLAGERVAWPLQLAQASRWCGPGWALAGDAAHTLHPLAGQGLNLGLADARELAQVMHRREYWRSVGDEKLLRRYERSRKSQVSAMQWATDGLQQLFAQDGEPWAWVRTWGLRGFDRSGPLKLWVARQAAGRF